MQIPPNISKQPNARAKRQRGWCIWRERKKGTIGYSVRLGKRLFGEERERWFSTRAAAERWVEGERQRIAQVGQSAWTPSREHLLELERLVQIRDAAIESGLSVPSLLSLVEDGVARVRAEQRRPAVAISESIERWETAKAKKSGEHVAKCVLVFARFRDWFGGNRLLAEVTAADAQRWVDSLAVADNTRTRYADRLSSLWAWAAKPQRGWVVENPWEAVETEPLKHGRPEVLTVDQTRILLRAAAEEDGQTMLPFLVLGLFAGPRIAENKRLTWDSLVLEDGEEAMIVDPDDAKTGARRAVPLPPVAVAWLRYYSGSREGAIAPTSFNFRRERILARAGFSVKARTSNNAGVPIQPIDGAGPWKWPRNGLRHSYCSYAVAHLRDLNEVAFRAGNSPRVLQRDYRSAVTTREGDAYFSLFPTAVLTDSAKVAEKKRDFSVSLVA